MYSTTAKQSKKKVFVCRSLLFTAWTHATPNLGTSAFLVYTSPMMLSADFGAVEPLHRNFLINIMHCTMEFFIHVPVHVKSEWFYLALFLWINTIKMPVTPKKTCLVCATDFSLADSSGAISSAFPTIILLAERYFAGAFSTFQCRSQIRCEACKKLSLAPVVKMIGAPTKENPLILKKKRSIGGYTVVEWVYSSDNFDVKAVQFHFRLKLISLSSSLKISGRTEF